MIFRGFRRKGSGGFTDRSADGDRELRGVENDEISDGVSSALAAATVASGAQSKLRTEDEPEEDEIAEADSEGLRLGLEALKGILKIWLVVFALGNLLLSLVLRGLVSCPSPS